MATDWHAWQAEGYGEWTARDAVLFFEVIIVQAAAVAHTCTTCKRPIAPGRPYTRTVSMSRRDDAPWVTKEHVSCWDEADDQEENPT